MAKNLNGGTVRAEGKRKEYEVKRTRTCCSSSSTETAREIKHAGMRTVPTWMRALPKHVVVGSRPMLLRVIDTPVPSEDPQGARD